MFEIGVRFERAARAVAADRWELAIYDVDEIAEVFESELVGAKWMANANAAKLARQFSTESIPSLQKALHTRDARSFVLAIESVSRACNACHRDVGKPFIEISAVPGASVPVLEKPTAPR